MCEWEDSGPGYDGLEVHECAWAPAAMVSDEGTTWVFCQAHSERAVAEGGVVVAAL